MSNKKPGRTAATVPDYFALLEATQDLEARRAFEVFVAAVGLELADLLKLKVDLDGMFKASRNVGTQTRILAALAEFARTTSGLLWLVQRSAFKRLFEMKLLALGAGASRGPKRPRGRPRGNKSTGKPKRRPGAPRRWNDSALADMLEMCGEDIQKRRQDDHGNVIVTGAQWSEQFRRDWKKHVPEGKPPPSAKTLANRLALARRKSHKTHE